MARYKLTIEYDGAPYCGFQYQDNQKTVQGCLENALAALNNGDPVRIHVCGRTDAGVHAFGQVAHVDLEKEFDAFTLMQAINYHLVPEKISVVDAEMVDEDFHARFSCTGRRYFYRIINRRPRLTIDEGRAWQVVEELDADAMHEAAQLLLGTHDFSSFRASECQSNSPVKTLDRFDIMRVGNEIHAHLEAKSFLHHQVRNMVGTLRLIGNGKWTQDDLMRALEAKDRAAGGENAPAYGLYFMEAYY